MLLKVISSLLLLQGGRNKETHQRPAAARSSYITTTSLFSAKRTIEVCLSPGCVADGADGVLLKMQALAPSDISVVEGGCCSLCGNGPIVMDEESNKKYRKVSENKIIQILTEDEILDPKQAAVLEGFNLVLEGDEALDKNDYTTAVEYYSKAMEIGLEAAVAIGEDQKETASTKTDVQPQALNWVISARCSEAKAKIGLRDAEGAISSAESAFELSCNSCTDSLELLQEACQMKGDDVGELNALVALFDLPEPEKPIAMQANKRRSLGFRLAKLKATVGS